MRIPRTNRAFGRHVSGSNISRREAMGRLAGAAGAAALPMVVPSRVLGADAPSKRTTLGFIGVGTHGWGHNLRSFLEERDAQAVAVCDVFASRRKKAKETVDAKYGDKACREDADFREILGRKEIDAVVISTPDHWHVPISLMALEAGKNVFCEKPTLTIAEGRALADAVARHKAVFQVGIEDRSIIYYHKMAELARNGALGKLRAIHVKLPAGNNYPKEEPAPVPKELNWDLWLGPAPFHAYTKSITEWMHWRQVRDFSGGLLTDWGAHLLDTAQVANSAELSGPVEVEGHGEVPKDSMVSTFSQYKLHYRYANGVDLFVESGGVAIRIEGTDGWVGNNGWRGRLESNSQDLLRRKFPAESNKIWPLPPYEHRNFLDCVKSRKPTTYTAETGHRLSTVMHIGNIAMQLGRKLKWDPQTESFVGDDAANALRSRVSRDDWKKGLS
jgi:myo-inositol 2-dehydrogenase / D-chiro-inositol 1-dehydrogenase